MAENRLLGVYRVACLEDVALSFLHRGGDGVVRVKNAIVVQLQRGPRGGLRNTLFAHFSESREIVTFFLHRLLLGAYS
jgi:hypothetical protein